LLDLLATEEDHRKALAREWAGLADLERVAALDAAEVAREIGAIAAEPAAVLRGGYVPQVRQMIRKLLDGGRLRCEPVEVDGQRGYRFSAPGTYARLFTGVVIHDLRVPEGTPSKRVSANAPQT
jgi:hypothetical protein